MAGRSKLKTAKALELAALATSKQSPESTRTKSKDAIDPIYLNNPFLDIKTRITMSSSLVRGIIKMIFHG